MSEWDTVDAVVGSLKVLVKDGRASSAEREALNLLLQQEKEIARLKAELQEQHDALDRIWEALGITTYEDAKGKEISELVAALRAERDLAQAKCAEMESGLRLADQLAHLNGQAGKADSPYQALMDMEPQIRAAAQDYRLKRLETKDSPDQPLLDELNRLRDKSIMDEGQIHEMYGRIDKLNDRLAVLEQDSNRLEWLMHSDATVAYSKDGDDCWLHWPYGKDGGSDSENQSGCYQDPRKAIDEALAAL